MKIAKIAGILHIGRDADLLASTFCDISYDMMTYMTVYPVRRIVSTIDMRCIQFFNRHPLYHELLSVILHDIRYDHWPTNVNDIPGLYW